MNDRRRRLGWVRCVVATIALHSALGPAWAASTGNTASSADIIAMKQQVIALNSSLIMLEEDLQSAYDGQISVFLSIDSNVRTLLKQVRLQIGGSDVSDHRYGARELHALANGGVQRLYLGNLPSGNHEISAHISGRWPSDDGSAISHRIRVTVGSRPALVELHVVDSHDLQQPYIQVRQWQPSLASDLRFNTALYAYYSQDYLAALSQLHVARQRGGILGFGLQPLLLEGVSYLAFGMPKQAEDRFRELAETPIPTRTRNAICLHRCRVTWQELSASMVNNARFYLGKLLYSSGDYEAAESQFEHIDLPLRRLLAQELEAMRINSAIWQGDLVRARKTLAQGSDLGPWNAYAHYNLGVSLLQQGDSETGLKHLEQVAAMPANADETRTLGDAALLAMGQEQLGRSDYVAAADYFQRVRANSPELPLALWGYGLSQASADNYRGALAPWRELSRQRPVQPAVQAALLALPYAYEQVGTPAEAGAALGEADAALHQALGTQSQLLDEVTANGVLDSLTSSNWPAADNPWEAHIDLLSNRRVQSALQRLSDQKTLHTGLNYWRVQLPRYQEALARLQRSGQPRRSVLQASVVDLSATSATRITDVATPIPAPETDIEPGEIAQQLDQLRRRIGRSVHWNSAHWPWQEHQVLLDLKRTLPHPTLQQPRLQPTVSSDELKEGEAASSRLKRMQQELQQQASIVDQALRQTEAELNGLVVEALSSRQQQLQLDLAHARLERARLSHQKTR